MFKLKSTYVLYSKAIKRMTRWIAALSLCEPNGPNKWFITCRLDLELCLILVLNIVILACFSQGHEKIQSHKACLGK